MPPPDPKIQQLVDIGFDPLKAAEALEHTDSVSEAIDWLSKDSGADSGGSGCSSGGSGSGSGGSGSAGGTARAGSSSAAPSHSPASAQDDQVTKIMAMGFTAEQAREALQHADSVDAAVNWLFRAQ
jgi:uncharacterized UBP type Zn finger protein